MKFDKIKSFRFYFSHNNFEEIILEMNILKKKRIRTKQSYFKKAIFLNKFLKILSKQKRNSQAQVGVKNTFLVKRFNFFRNLQKKKTEKFNLEILKN